MYVKNEIVRGYFALLYKNRMKVLIYKGLYDVYWSILGVKWSVFY